jgi:AcrR family transcriptional regulator
MMVTKKNKERDIERTRQQILDAAVAEFSAHGFSGGRVDRISRQAGVNKAMIYYIFKNKHELHLAVLEHLFEEKIGEVEGHLQQEEMTLQKIFPMLQDYFHTLFEKREYTGLILHDLATGANALRELRRRRPDLFEEFDVLGAMLKTLGQSGFIREVDPDKGVAMIIVMIIGLAGILPHMDLFADSATDKFQELTDKESWLAFIADMLLRILKPTNSAIDEK